MAATLSFHEALNNGIASGTFADTKTILFSRRNASGRVCGPKALYASSHVLRSVPYFNDLLFGGFSEAQPKDLSDDLGDDEFAQGGHGYYSDSDLEDDEDEEITPPKTIHTGLTNKGKVLRIQDMAFLTFRAFLFYLYTGQIEFGSQEDRSVGATKAGYPSNEEIPRPSPKSIYRLADKYDIPALKDLALNRFLNELTSRDIVKETFSEFAARYDEIRAACVTRLVFALQNDTAEKATWTKVCEIADGHFGGDIKHVTGALSLLWKTLNQDGDTIPPPNPPSIEIPANWSALHTAIARSIHEGAFFDRKYLVRHSRNGSTLKTIYFSSVIAANELEACTTRSGDQSTPTEAPVGEDDVESDCESGPTGTEEGESVSEQDCRGEGECGGCEVLTPGTFAVWRSLFFYQCTNQILFAPLKSQGVNSRLRYILEKTTADTPPPCSPKTIYVLAKLLNIQPLCDLAFKDIESKLSEDNIVEEFFSRATASQQQILEMECRLLFSKFKGGATISRVQEKIAVPTGGNSTHRAGAFKLGLQAALKSKKQRPQIGAPPQPNPICPCSICQPMPL